VVQPLGSFGFYANNDGLIYDVAGPFDDDTVSPAWKTGMRPGDRLDLSRLRCSLKDLASADMRWLRWAGWNTSYQGGKPSSPSPRGVGNRRER
jgi:hypothetical protein